MKTVLVVDDELHVLVVLRRLLGHRMNVITATNGVDARALIRDNHVDAVLIDVMLPDESGVQLGAHVLAHHPGTKVIFTSGYPREMLERLGISLGDGRLLEKPMDIEDLERFLSIATPPP